MLKFIMPTEDSAVRAVISRDTISSTQPLPFATRPTWLSIQADCLESRRPMPT